MCGMGRDQRAKASLSILLRDGQPTRCIKSFEPGDRPSLRRFAEGSGGRRRDSLRGWCRRYLFSFRRTFHRQRGRSSARDDLAYFIEVFRTDERLVFDRAVPFRPGSELLVLQLSVRGHPAILVILGKADYREVQRVETRERHELEAVAHAGEFGLEGRDRGRTELFSPVEGRGAVVGEDLAREAGVDRVREGTCLLEIRPGCFAPEHVRVWRIGETASDRRG